MGARLRTILGIIWAAPVTAFALLYVGVFCALRWYKFHEVDRANTALVFLTNKEKMPAFLAETWSRWGGQAIGNVIILNVELGTKRHAALLKHEATHVSQFMRGGIVMAVAYPLCMLFIKWMCLASDPYYSNPFEIDARRNAGQTIDVEGVRKKAALEKAVLDKAAIEKAILEGKLE